MNAINWNTNWIEAGAIDEAGGQASVKIVSEKRDQHQIKRFLKVLNRQNDAERRARFYREVSIYQTLNHQNIPKIIETNAEHYLDSSYKLYLVTEFFAGKTLSKHIEIEGRIEAIDAIKLAIQLLEIIKYCHKNECVHRDIKPDNIVLSNNDLQNPILVDFGISFNAQDSNDFQTELDQEIGNRFLRLPELGIGSPNKRDPRSDTTSICGILFFALTGMQPAALINEQSQLPHQRNDPQAIIAQLPQGRQLFAIFDRGFQNSISSRWNSPEDLIIRLNQILKQSVNPQLSTDSASLLAQIKRDADSENYSRLQQQRNIIAKALHQLDEMYSMVVREIGMHFDTMQRSSNLSTDAMKLHGRGIRSIDGKIEIWFWLKISIIGANLILSIVYNDDEFEVLRTDSQAPVFDEIFREEAKVKFLTVIRDRIAAI